MSEITEKEILDIMQNALKLKEKSLTIDSSMSNVEEWDSLGHLSILVALDKFFNGKIAGVKDLVSADSVNKIINILKENSLL